MNKFQFIKHLLETKKFTPSQKERFFKLVSSELADVGNPNQEILEDIRLIKERLGMEEADKKGKDSFLSFALDPAEQEDVLKELTSEQIIQITSLGKKKNVPEPNPKHVADFMSLFNKRDGLKYLTHDYDENSEFEIDKLLISAKKVFDDAAKKLNIPQSLWRIVKQFAFDSEQTEWSSISKDYKNSLPLKIGWATNELRAWSKQNKLHPIHKEEYKKIIDDFKRITRIGEGNLNMLIKTVLEKVFADKFNDYEIVEKELSKADFYSNVGYFKIALETIFEEIKKYTIKHEIPDEKKKITLEYSRGISPDNYYLRTLRITHHYSYPIKELAILLQEWHEKGNMGKIKEKLKGYCHWSIETIIEKEPVRVNILKESDTKTYEKLNTKPEGFTHVLTFYYK